MGIGTSLFLIAVGAILKFAVTDVSGIKLETVGAILMVVGIIGLVITLLLSFSGRDRRPARARPAGLDSLHTRGSSDGAERAGAAPRRPPSPTR